MLLIRSQIIFGLFYTHPTNALRLLLKSILEMGTFPRRVSTNWDFFLWLCTILKRLRNCFSTGTVVASFLFLTLAESFSASAKHFQV